MSRIDDAFGALRRRGEKAFIPYLTGGDPDLAATGRYIRTLAASGADLIEVGVPFSDPIADGPTIQRASQRALRSGTTVERILELVKDLRPDVEPPLILMSYFNPVLKMGIEEFARRGSQAGLDGVIIPDLPPEEAGTLVASCRREGIDTIFLVAPTTPDARVRLVAEYSRGFLYYVSRTGVTGVRERLAAGIRENIARIRAVTPLPIAVGFGISTPEQARLVAAWSDGIVVGSALVSLIETAKNSGQLETELSRVTSAFRRELKFSSSAS